MDFYEIYPRIFLAVLLGALIGLEREFTQKSAGLRTHILVTLGATIFTLVSMSDFYHGITHVPYANDPNDTMTHDPSRVAAQIVAGIGFIGGGAVLRYGTTVRGLTTAASLWSMASIGMLVGIGQYRLSIVSTIVIFLVLFTIGKIERMFFSKHARGFNRLKIHIVTGTTDLLAAQNWMDAQYHDSILEAKTRTDASTDRVEMNYIINTSSRKRIEVTEISRQLCRIDGVVGSTVKTFYENEELS